MDRFKTFNNTGARILDSFYQKTLKFLRNGIFGLKTTGFCRYADRASCSPHAEFMTKFHSIYQSK